ncbi:MAG: tetratricopeptide repeat protein, partial [Synechococcus sp.]
MTSSFYWLGHQSNHGGCLLSPAAAPSVDSRRLGVGLAGVFLSSLQDLALSAYQEGRREDARSLLQKLFSEDETCAVACHLLGILEQEEGRVVEALQCFERALALGPSDHAVYCNMGNALRGLGDYVKAI